MAPVLPKTTMFQEAGCSLPNKWVYPLSFNQGFNDEAWMEIWNAVAESFFVKRISLTPDLTAEDLLVLIAQARGY